MLPCIHRHGRHSLPTELRDQLSMPQEHTRQVLAFISISNFEFWCYEGCLFYTLGVAKIADYMLHKLQIEESQVPKMCLDLYKEYGTTMAGLKACLVTTEYWYICSFSGSNFCFITSEKSFDLFNFHFSSVSFWAMISTMTTSTPVSMVHCRMKSSSLTPSWGSCYFPCHRGR